MCWQPEGTSFLPQHHLACPLPFECWALAFCPVFLSAQDRFRADQWYSHVLLREEGVADDYLAVVIMVANSMHWSPVQMSLQERLTIIQKRNSWCIFSCTWTYKAHTVSFVYKYRILRKQHKMELVIKTRLFPITPEYSVFICSSKLHCHCWMNKTMLHCSTASCEAAFLT